MGEACTLDPRGNRAEIGYFVKGSEPITLCDCHILCDFDREYGGISHGNCPLHVTERVGLIQVERSFPIQILVTDAQYVYRGDPLEMPINQNPSNPYFFSFSEPFCGISPGKDQFNRSCQAHLYPAEEAPLEYWFSHFFEKPVKRIKRKITS